MEGLIAALDLAKLSVHSEFKWCSVHCAGKLIINLTDKNAVLAEDQMLSDDDPCL